MTRRFYYALCFIVVIMACIVVNMRVAPILIRYGYGPGTEERLRLGFENALTYPFRWLALGNSRMYRGLDPDLLSVPTYNFAHEDATLSQCYYKLLYLEKHHVPFDTILLNVDYFSFSTDNDTRNYIFKDYFDAAYLRDFGDKSQERPFQWVWQKDFFSQQNEKFNRWMTIHFSHTLPSALNFALRWLQRQPLAVTRYVKSNGQYIVEGAQAYSSDYIVRDAQIIPRQREYFEKILAFAAERRLRVVLVMLPLRDGELKNYDPSVIDKTETYVRQQINANVFYFNYARAPQFGINDYADITHLTPAGAKKFTAMFEQDLRALPK